MGPSDTPLSLYDAANNRRESGFDDLAQSLAVGDTRVFGHNTVNALRFAFNRSAVRRLAQDTFDPYDLGADAYSYYPHVMSVIVQGGFRVPNQGPGRFVANAAQLTNDLTLVRGAHQISVGGNVAYWRYRLQAHALSGGWWMFTGNATGLGLADLLMGKVASLEHSGPALLPMDQWYLGIYAQDSWRASPRVTLNVGVRWEPYFGQNILNGAIYNFSLENFRNNVKSTVFTNAPAGLIYPGDAGFPPGRSGLYTQWWNLSPRVGLAWDVMGNSRTALRAAYGLAYDFPPAEYHLFNAQASPFSNRTVVRNPPGGFDRPYAHLGGDPHPIVTSPDVRYFPYSSFGATDPHINSPRIQQWNVTIERRIGATWQVAASYLGSHTDRLWNQVAMNPGVFLGLGPCTLNGVFYTTCSTDQNLDQRRELSLSGQNPAAARLIGSLELHTNLGVQDYRGLKLSFLRRASGGVSLGGTYTVSRCFGDPAIQTGSFAVTGSQYTNPDDPGFDRGVCDQDRTHLASFTVTAQTPSFAAGALGALASGWRISGIVSARSGAPINVITGVGNAGDRALTGDPIPVRARSPAFATPVITLIGAPERALTMPEILQSEAQEPQRTGDESRRLRSDGEARQVSPILIAQPPVEAGIIGVRILAPRHSEAARLKGGVAETARHRVGPTEAHAGRSTTLKRQLQSPIVLCAAGHCVGPTKAHAAAGTTQKRQLQSPIACTPRLV